MTLYNSISENIILPVSDILTRQGVHNSLIFLKKSQFWTREQIDNYQNKKLRTLIQHASANVPYYKDLFHDLKLSCREIQTKDDLNKLPILTKSIIKQEGTDRFTSSAFHPEKLMHRSSSGSTGAPLYYKITNEAYSMNIACNLRGWYSMGYRLGDKFIKLSQNPRNSLIKQWQDKLTRNLYVPIKFLTDENLNYILQKIEEYQPKIIRCYPDPLLFLARYKQNHPEFAYSPHAINCTGNTLHPETRREIETAFGCEVFDSYSSEGNSCVFECPTHQGYHSAEEYGISEILDEAGQAITIGVGRLISTDLWNLAHPFIRYDTQDFVEIDQTPCNCGRQQKKINRILGRDNEILVMQSGKKFIVHHFTTFFSSTSSHINKSIEQFQVVYTKESSVLFRLITNNNFNNSIKEYIQNFWIKELDTKVDIELVKEIPLTLSGKRKFILIES